jgi:hypothetical protein
MGSPGSPPILGAVVGHAGRGRTGLQASARQASMGHSNASRLHCKESKIFTYSSAAENERPVLWGRLSVPQYKGEPGCTLLSDRPQWDTRVLGVYIAKKAKYLHSSAAENERREEKMQILQGRFK